MVWRAAIMASPAPREARVASHAMGFRSRCQATLPCTRVTVRSRKAARGGGRMPKRVVDSTSSG